MAEELNVFQIYEEPAKELVQMIKQIKYKPGWTFTYAPPLTLVIAAMCEDSTGETTLPQRVTHRFKLPPMCFPLTASHMREWLIRQIVLVEIHETCENFKLPNKNGEYYAPFFPHTEAVPDMNQYQIIDKTEED